MTDEDLKPNMDGGQEPFGEAGNLAEALEEQDADLATPEVASEGDSPLASEAARPRLVLKRGGAEVDEVFELNPPSVVGRFDPSVGPIDVDLASIPEGSYVSRKHAKITNEDGVWRIQDLGSSNGTFILRDDFEKVEEAELTDGAEIAFGNARFVFRLS
jgi:hypothetical protein